MDTLHSDYSEPRTSNPFVPKTNAVPEFFLQYFDLVRPMVLLPTEAVNQEFLLQYFHLVRPMFYSMTDAVKPRVSLAIFPSCQANVLPPTEGVHLQYFHLVRPMFYSMTDAVKPRVSLAIFPSYYRPMFLPICLSKTRNPIH